MPFIIAHLLMSFVCSHLSTIVAIRITGATGSRLESAVGARQQLERFAVTAALKKMPELRIDFLRQTLFETFDFLRDGSESFGMMIWILSACLVADNGQAFAQGRGEFCENGVHRKSLKRAGVWRKRPL